PYRKNRRGLAGTPNHKYDLGRNSHGPIGLHMPYLGPVENRHGLKDHRRDFFDLTPITTKQQAINNDLPGSLVRVAQAKEEAWSTSHKPRRRAWSTTRKHPDLIPAYIICLLDDLLHIQPLVSPRCTKLSNKT
ncbi:hypothetical protein HAX54_026691, partial [Datura stramonium]|nr:hypothetical protein [Datura stramonium]